MRCRNCLDNGVQDNGCSHCMICGDSGVSHDPRFQRGGWCDVCVAKDDLEQAEKRRDNE